MNSYINCGSDGYKGYKKDIIKQLSKSIDARFLF